MTGARRLKEKDVVPAASVSQVRGRLGRSITSVPRPSSKDLVTVKPTQVSQDNGFWDGNIESMEPDWNSWMQELGELSL
jgi:hypothetical protein